MSQARIPFPFPMPLDPPGPRSRPADGQVATPVRDLRDEARARTKNPSIAHVAVAFPDHVYGQAELLGSLERRWKERPKVQGLLRKLHGSVAVASRRLALPLKAYDELNDFGAANDAFIRVGTELGARAVRDAIEHAGLRLRDVDALFFTTVTGLATPTIDARLVNVLGLRPDVRRTPMFGLGCVGGAAGLARARDYLLGHPEHVAVLLSVELCSLTLQDDVSVANLIASGLFGDGAAAAVMVGSAWKGTRRSEPAALRRPPAGDGPRVLGSTSVFFPSSERVMGWDIGPKGFKIVLSADVPSIVRDKLPREVDAFLGKHDLTRADIRHWVCHPGGPKVILAIEEALALPTDALKLTRDSLTAVGNLSSASVLHVLAQTNQKAKPGELGLLLAMGPGFCAELVLLAW